MWALLCIEARPPSVFAGVMEEGEEVREESVRMCASVRSWEGLRYGRADGVFVRFHQAAMPARAAPPNRPHRNSLYWYRR